MLLSVDTHSSGCLPSWRPLNGGTSCPGPWNSSARISPALVHFHAVDELDVGGPAPSRHQPIGLGAAVLVGKDHRVAELAAARRRLDFVPHDQRQIGELADGVGPGVDQRRHRLRGEVAAAFPHQLEAGDVNRCRSGAFGAQVVVAFRSKVGGVPARTCPAARHIPPTPHRAPGTSAASRRRPPTAGAQQPRGRPLPSRSARSSARIRTTTSPAASKENDRVRRSVSGAGATHPSSAAISAMTSAFIWTT